MQTGFLIEYDKKNETLTKCIHHKGFSAYSSFVTRSNFRVGGQETAPQFLTAHTLSRYSKENIIKAIKAKG